MSYAKGVNAKSFNYDKTVEEPSIDFLKMMRIIKETGIMAI